MMQSYFHDLVDLIGAALRGAEVYTCAFSAEASDFIRFNHNRVRQAGTVTQRWLTLDLIAGRRHATGSLVLSGDLELDRARIGRSMRDLREKRAELPEDPFLLYATDVRSSERCGENHLPDSPAVVADLRTAGHGRDLVGLYTAGGIFAGFANSFGQRNWHASYSYHFGWSFHLEGGRAVKCAHAGVEWQPDRFVRTVSQATEQLAALSRPPRSVLPGRYRVYLAPAAVFDLVDLLSWGGFGLRAHRTKATPLLKMTENGVSLDPRVSILENTRDGIAPDFQEAGFIRPDRVDLITCGAYQDCLVSPRSAMEFGVPTNGASAAETPQSVEVVAGEVPAGDVLRRLGTGIYVSNLWYLNYSDRTACRITGMTRFATFWVKHGVIQAPLDAMRFDDTIYRMLGDNLLGLTSERDLILDPDTYLHRSTRSARLPGILAEDVTFTL